MFSLLFSSHLEKEMYHGADEAGAVYSGLLFNQGALPRVPSQLCHTLTIGCDFPQHGFGSAEGRAPSKCGSGFTGATIGIKMVI